MLITLKKHVTYIPRKTNRRATSQGKTNKFNGWQKKKKKNNKRKFPEIPINSTLKNRVDQTTKGTQGPSKNNNINNKTPTFKVTRLVTHIKGTDGNLPSFRAETKTGKSFNSVEPEFIYQIIQSEGTVMVN